ncbi:MAG: hypothetical protein MSH60_03220 [Ruminococcus sp.]|nr:hypothetical protein [Ruminococcus sp.]
MAAIALHYVLDSPKDNTKHPLITGISRRKNP